MKIPVSTFELLLFLAYCLSVSDCAKILGFLPFPAKSHQNVFAPILAGLADKGHDVTYITPVAPNVKSPRLKVILMKDYLAEFLVKIDLITLGLLPAPLVSHRISEALELSQEDMYGGAVAQALIHSNDTYDAVILESAFGQEAASALLHKFGCVAIEIASLGDCSWVNELSGLPDNPAFQMDFKSPNSDQMTFWQRMYNTYVTMSTVLVSYYHLSVQQTIMDRYFNYTGWESRPSVGQLASNRSLVLINADHSLTYPYPLAPHAKLVGGINILPDKPLPDDLQKYMDEAKEGVIYFSMGSNLKTAEFASSPIGQAFLNVFNNLPQKILLKWENNADQIELPKNVKTSPWFPQQDILAHKNCKLFISHGGFLSTVETMYHGVPLLGLPIFGDQKKNMHLAAKSGYGIMLDHENITQTSVAWAIREILQSPRYKEEAMRRSRMLRDRRHTSLEEAVYWIEYVIKYPNSLTPASAHMSFIEMHLIDVQLTILAILAAALFILYRMFCGLVGLYRRKPTASQRKPKQKKS